MEKTSFEVQWLERCLETELVVGEGQRVAEKYADDQLRLCRDPKGRPFRFAMAKDGRVQYALWLAEKHGLLHRVPTRVLEEWQALKEQHS